MRERREPGFREFPITPGIARPRRGDPIGARAGAGNPLRNRQHAAVPAAACLGLGVSPAPRRNLSFTTGATGSGAGIAGASAGTVNIGASDAYLSSGDLVKNPTLLNIPLAISAQQVNYNLPGLAAKVHLRLNGQVLALMYEGKVTAWNDPAIAKLNPGVRLPGTRVVPVHRSDSSGDTFLFTSYLSTHDPGWNTVIGYGTTVAWPAASGALSEHGNTGMVSGCRATPGCVAYVGISYLSSALAGGLGEARLANTLGHYELPTAAAMRAAVASFVSSTPVNETISMVDGPAPGGYPIVNYEYAIVSRKQRSATEARDARAWYAVNDQVYRLDSAAHYAAETQLVIGTGRGSSAAGFGRVEDDLSRAIAADQVIFHSNAAAGRNAFSGLAVGIIVAAVLMAAGCAWGLARRLAEYR